MKPAVVCALGFLLWGQGCGEEQAVQTPTDVAAASTDLGASPEDVGLDIGGPEVGPADVGTDTSSLPDASAADVGVSDVGIPRCAAAPSCPSLDPGTVEHFAVALPGCGFTLRRSADADVDARIASIAAAGSGFVGLNAVDLNREAQSGVTAGTADRLKNHDFFGFRWSPGDMTTLWYPQGVTGEQDAQVGGARRLLVSWYDNNPAAPEKGTRLSVVDLSDPAAIRYRHLLLVEPVGDPAAATFGAALTGSGASLHAGGITWVGDYLYVADTTQGFRVFDLSRIIEVNTFDDTSRIGVGQGRVDAFGYRYIVPQIARYRLAADSCPVRFSFVSLDRSETPPMLVSGEYTSDDPHGRIVRWDLDAATGWLAEEAGLARARDAFVGGQTRMQGAMTLNGDLYLSSSSQAGSLGRLYRTRPGLESRITAWVYGAEDLYYEASVGRVWTAAEHPNARDTVSIPLVLP